MIYERSWSRRALLALAASSAVAAERKLRIGIVGGRFGKDFQFHLHPNCVVEAVSDLREDRRGDLARTYSCGKTYPSLAELLKDRQVEAVGLFTPAPDHVAHALQCFEAGKHVLSAVPAAMSLEDCGRLIEAVKRTGLTYMMAETSYYQQMTISARKFYREGAFGNLYACESEYHHAGLDELFWDRGKPTWRHGFPPMLYPTHCTAHLLGVTGERITRVSCLGWGDADPILKTNAYKNPFWNETAFFETDRGTPFRVQVWWKGAHRGTERAQYYGDKMSLFFPDPNGLSAKIVRWSDLKEKDSGGFERQGSLIEDYPDPKWWSTDMLPPALRSATGHQGSHAFLTHEFVSAVLEQRKPAVDVHEAVAYTAPGIVAHESALKGGTQMKVPSFG